MSRVINPNQPGKLRKEILRVLAAAVTAYDAKRSEKAPGNGPEVESRDLVAFTLLSLLRVEQTVARTVEPWEKRDYWLKADRFRQEWEWAGRLAGELSDAVGKEAWQDISRIMARVTGKLGDTEPLKKHLRMRPWQGAWQIWTEQQAGGGRRSGALKREG